MAPTKTAAECWLELDKAKAAVTHLLNQQGMWEEQIDEARKKILGLAEKIGEAYHRQFEAEVAFLAADVREKLAFAAKRDPEAKAVKVKDLRKVIFTPAPPLRPGQKRLRILDTCMRCHCLVSAHHGPGVGCEGAGGNCGCDFTQEQASQYYSK